LQHLMIRPNFSCTKFGIRKKPQQPTRIPPIIRNGKPLWKAGWSHPAKA
jgi:hypothetical protein